MNRLRIITDQVQPDFGTYGDVTVKQADCETRVWKEQKYGRSTGLLDWILF